MPPSPLCASPLTSYQGQGGSLKARKYGLRLDVPPGALPGSHVDPADNEKLGPQALLALSTPLPHRVAHLFEAEGSPRQGDLALSPIVTLECLWPAGSPQARAQAALDAVGRPAAAGEAGEADGAGAAAPPEFDQKVLLTMPHCLSLSDGDGADGGGGAAESGGGADGGDGAGQVAASSRVMVLGCPEGGEAWQPIRPGNVRVEEHQLSVMVRWPGTFLACSQPDVDEATLVRLYVLLPPKLPPHRASSLRVHLCPLLPTQLEELELEEHCEWGQARALWRPSRSRCTPSHPHPTPPLHLRPHPHPDPPAPDPSPLPRSRPRP